MTTMTKEGALRSIVYDISNKRPTRTSYNRVVRAMKILELSPEEQRGILRKFFGYNQDGSERDPFYDPPDDFR